MCEICSKLIITIAERRHWYRSCVIIVNFEQLSHIILVSLLLILNKQMPAGTQSLLLFFAKDDPPRWILRETDVFLGNALVSDENSEAYFNISNVAALHILKKCLKISGSKFLY